MYHVSLYQHQASSISVLSDPDTHHSSSSVPYQCKGCSPTTILRRITQNKRCSPSNILCSVRQRHLSGLSTIGGLTTRPAASIEQSTSLKCVLYATVCGPSNQDRFRWIHIHMCTIQCTCSCACVHACVRVCCLVKNCMCTIVHATTRLPHGRNIKLSIF